MAKNFLTIFGHINLDIVLRVPKIPNKGSINVLERKVCCGGTAYNMALISARLGVPVNLYSFVGKDLLECVDNLRKEGVDVSNVVVSETPGPHCYILDDLTDQIAAIYQGPMTNPKFIVRDYGEWVHFYTGPPERYLDIARKLSAKIAFDPAQEVFYRYSKEIIQEFFSVANILFCNANEYKYIRDLVERIEVPQIVVTLGADGCMLIRNNEKKFFSANKVDTVVRTVGAGDAFRAGFYRALYEGRSIEECCIHGNYIASRYVSGTL